MRLFALPDLLRFASFLLLTVGNAQALDFNNETITGNVVLPGGETHRFFNTITLDNAVVDVFGYLRNEQAPVTVTGNGQVNIYDSVGIEGIWTDGWVNSYLTIGSGIEVQAAQGGRFYSTGINKGTIAAVLGDASGTAVDGIYSSVELDDFTNEGLFEVRSGGRMSLSLRDGLFENMGTIRVQPGGKLKIGMNIPLAPTQLRSIDNHGATNLIAFLLQGSGALNLSGSGLYTFDRRTSIIHSTINISPMATARVITQSDDAFHLDGAIINGNLQSAVGSDALIENGLELNGRWDFQSAEILFNGSQTISGNAKFGAGQFRAKGDDLVTFGPMTQLNPEPGTRLTLWNFYPDSNTASFLLQGSANVDGSELSGLWGRFENAGMIHAYNSGRLLFAPSYRYGTIKNSGTILVDSGASLEMSAAVYNQGNIIVDNANLLLRAAPRGSGTLSITDSQVFAGNMTLSEIAALSRVRSEVAVAGSVDLEEDFLTITDVDNQRWTLAGGAISNGWIESADGFELRTVASPSSSSNLSLLRDVVLNANVRVTAEGDLQVNGGVTGTGSIVLENGRLQVNGGLVRGGDNGEPMNSDVLAMIEPDPTALDNVVSIYGELDNTDRIILLKKGAQWEYSSGRNVGIIGGRIEGDPGVALSILDGRISGQGDLRDITLAAPLEIAAREALVREGLALEGTSISIVDRALMSSMTDTQLVFGGDQILDGIGEVRFERSTAASSGDRRVSVKEGTLEIAAGISIRTHTSSGTIAEWAPSGNPLLGASLTSHGTLLAENGHTLSIVTSSFQQLGTLRTETDSTLAVDDQSLLNQGSLELAGGAMTFSGDLSLDSSGSLSFVVSSDMLTSQNASLEVTGALFLGGTFEASLETGLSLAEGDSFLLASAAGGIHGAPEQFDVPELASGLAWLLSTDGHSLFLDAVSEGLPGDFSLDGSVDGADLLAWQQEASVASTPASDLNDWRTYYGRTVIGPITSQAVPEPNTATLLLACVFAVARRARTFMR